eukprot:2561169-Pyramimonas_sp.AAC.1
MAPRSITCAQGAGTTVDYGIICSNLFSRISQPNVDQDAATYPHLAVHFLVLVQDVEAWVRGPCEPSGWWSRAPTGCARFSRYVERQVALRCVEAAQGQAGLQRAWDQ